MVTVSKLGAAFFKDINLGVVSHKHHVARRAQTIPSPAPIIETIAFLVGLKTLLKFCKLDMRPHRKFTNFL